MKNLYDIYREAIEKMGNQHVPCFRVRDVDSMSDYLICHPTKWQWDHNGMPSIMYGLHLAPDFTSFYPMPTGIKIYALLSSKDEIKYFKVVGNILAMDIAKRNYR